MLISQYLSEFQRWLKISVSEQTEKSYIKQIKVFIKDIGDLEVEEINKRQIEEWFILLKERAEIGYTTNCLWAMRCFLKFLLTEKEIPVWCFKNYRIPKRRRPEYIEHLENGEVNKLLESIDTNDIHGLRLRTYLEMLLNTGLRPSEALKLNREDIKNHEIEIIGKGNKLRKIYLNSRVKYWITQYLSARNDNHPAVFVTHCEVHRLALRTIEGSFEKYRDEIRPNKKITLHTMRHTYGTNLLQHGCPPDYIRRLLGHSKLETTRIYYLSITQKDVENAHYKYLNFDN